MRYKRILIIIVTMVLIFSIYQRLSSKTLSNNFFGVSIFIIQSGSMSPTLQIEEAILIKREKEYEVGDCITYQIENRYLITHRIIEKTIEGYWTKGDENNSKDEKIVKMEQIEGKVIYHSKLLGYLIKYINWILLILLIIFLLCR